MDILLERFELDWRFGKVVRLGIEVEARTLATEDGSWRLSRDRSRAEWRESERLPRLGSEALADMRSPWRLEGTATGCEWS